MLPDGLLSQLNRGTRISTSTHEQSILHTEADRLTAVYRGKARAFSVFYTVSSPENPLPVLTVS